MLKLVKESLLDSYPSFFDIDFNGYGTNDVFEILGERYIIDDIIINQENIYTMFVKNIENEEKIQIIVDANTNRAIDLKRNNVL